MEKIRKYSIVFLFLFFSIHTFAQLKNQLHFSADINKGQLIYAHGATKFLSFGYLNKINGSVFIWLDGKKKWHKQYKYPKVGFNFFYLDFGSPTYLGKSYTVSTSFLATYYQKNKFSMNMQFESGLGYLTKKFDFQTNPLNVLIGSHLNAYFAFSHQFAYRVHSQIDVFCGVSFNHFSNGKLNLPNYGLNSYIAEMGAQIKLTDIKNIHQWKGTDILPYRKTRQYILWGQGLKDAHILSNTLYYATALTYNISRLTGSINRFGGGADVFMDRSAMFQSPFDDSTQWKKSDMFSSGLYGSCDFVMGKTELFFHLGAYLLKRNNVEKHFIYERIGFRYFLRPHFFAGMALKANLLNADYIELGLGYAW